MRILGAVAIRGGTSIMRRNTSVPAAVIIVATLLTGCTVSKGAHGDGDNVKIATPFGGLQVKTNSADVLATIGLPAYPGAAMVRKNKDEGKEGEGSADVNLSFGSFQLKVKAASFRTSDSPDKVLAFYKKGLGRYGDVIQCDGKHAVGAPIRTTEGLTCDDSSNASGRGVHISGNDLQINGSGSDDRTRFQLKAGSKKHQHVVDIDPEGAGTKFGLVALDLPTDFHFGEGKDTEDKEDKQ